MKIEKASGRIGGWAAELVKHCEPSRESRIEQYRSFRSYYFDGSTHGTAPYNRIYSHIDRLSSFLYSPDDIRFSIEFDDEYGKQWRGIADAAAKKLNAEFHRRGVDIEFGKGVDWALTKGKTFLKLLWGYHGLEPWLVQPEYFAVYREDIASLDAQEAFVHTTYITQSELERQLLEHPDAKKLAEQIARRHAKKPGQMDSLQDDYIHQVLISGTDPVGATAGSAKGNVGISSAPSAILAPEVAQGLLRVDELWVQDSDRDDYTTIRLVHPDIVIEGGLRQRNMMSPFDGGTKDEPGDNPLRGEHPFIEICPNPVDGYFWGLSEIVNLSTLQDMLNESIESIDRLTKLKAEPPAAFIGFTGMNEQRYKALMVPRGYLAEQSPAAKIERLAPEIPPEIFTKVEKIQAWMDDEGGFAPIMMGQGEPGVRAGMHAQTLLRTGSPRMRDRALQVERQVLGAGELSLKYLQAKKATVYISKSKGKEVGEKFLLEQLPDDHRVAVDSHSGSPVFHEDNLQLAFALAKAQAIGAQGLILLTRPPHMDKLIEDADDAERAKANFMQQHPELLAKQGQRTRR